MQEILCQVIRWSGRLSFYWRKDVTKCHSGLLCTVHHFNDNEFPNCPILIKTYSRINCSAYRSLIAVLMVLLLVLLKIMFLFFNFSNRFDRSLPHEITFYFVLMMGSISSLVLITILLFKYTFVDAMLFLFQTFHLPLQCTE